MHQIRFPLGLHPLGGAYSAPAGPLDVCKGSVTSNRREGKRTGGEREGKLDGRGKEVEEGIWPTQKIVVASLWFSSTLALGILIIFRSSKESIIFHSSHLNCGLKLSYHAWGCCSVGRVGPKIVVGAYPANAAVPP